MLAFQSAAILSRYNYSGAHVAQTAEKLMAIAELAAEQVAARSVRSARIPAVLNFNDRIAASSLQTRAFRNGSVADYHR